MSRIIRRTAAVASVAAAALALAACAPLESAEPGPDTAEVVDGGELTLATTAAPPSWNPLTATGDVTTNRQQQWPLYPHTFLTGADSDVVLNEDLLESAEVVSDSPMTIEYVIRPEAVWSDGTPITADDFRYTAEVQNPAICADCTAALTEGYRDMTSVEGSDDGKTVEVTFETAYGAWRTLFPFILPAHVAASYGDLATSFNDGLALNPPTVSGGPYLIESYDPGVAMTLTRNPEWYGTAPHLDTVTFRYIASIAEQVTALQNDEIGALYGAATLDTTDQLQQLGGITTEVGPTLTYYHFSLKASGDVMGDVALRRAITTALDTDDMTARTVGQYAPEVEAMTSAAYIPGQLVGGEVAARDNTSSAGVGAGDVEEAAQILEDAGYTVQDGALHLPDGTRMRDLTVLTYSPDVTRVQLAELAQNQLAKIGITVDIDPADATRYTPAAVAGDFDLYATATALDLGAASLGQWYSTTGARNYFGLSDARVDELLEQIAVTTDDGEIVELTNELDERLLEDAVVVPLFPIVNIAAYDADIANIRVNPSKYGTTVNIQDWGRLAAGSEG
jgi:peptide/nickel transport system substrate-binding protein